jgi:YHS domain-containing protein
MKKLIAPVLAVVLCMTLILPCWGSAEKQVEKAPAKGSVAKIKDPVCGMEVDPAKGKEISNYQGKTYHFCSSHCKAEFDKNPAKYAK